MFLTVIFLILLIPAIVLAPPNFSLLDLPQFYAASKMLLNGQGAFLYTPDVLFQTEKLLFGKEYSLLYIPPFAAPLLSSIALIPVSIADSVWTIILLLSMLIGLLLLKKNFQLSRGELLWITIVVALSGPEWEALRHGQLAPILFLCFTVAILSLKIQRPIFAALFLSVLQLKPQLLLPVLAYLLGARRYKTILSLFLFSFLIFGISLFNPGLEAYKHYRELLSYSVSHHHWMAPEICPTFRGQLLRFFPQADFAVLIASITVLIVVLIIIFFLGRKFAQQNNWLELGLIISLPSGLITSLHCHNYDLLFLIPAIIVFYKQYRLKTLPIPATIILMLSCLLFMMPIYNFIHYYYILRGNPINPLFLALLLFVLCTIPDALKIRTHQINKENYNLHNS